MAESDKQLELKKRARRRLVGAAALALSAAIVLPMVMDHEPKPLTQDIQIRIPSPDSPRTGAPKAAAAEAIKPESKPNSSPATPPEAQAPSRSADDEPKPTQTAADKADAASSRQSSVKAETKPEPKATVKTETPAEPKEAAEPKPATKAERESRVESILAGKEPAAAGGSFVVQLGAFSEPANASKVRARVKEIGFSSYTEVVKGAKGEQTRVRAGPFASREAADQAAAKLKHAGLAGVVASR